MARAIAICNQKGGVGKSTTAVNLGAYLALSSRRTLLLDLDAQGNATTACGIQKASLEQDIYAALVGDVAIQDAIRPTTVAGLHIVPAKLDLAGAEAYLGSIENKELWLKRAIEGLRNSYDAILFDCPPSLALMTVNALVAADSVLLPVQCEYLALEGLNSLMQAIELVRQKLNQDLKICGIVLTMTDFRANLAREVSNDVRNYFKEFVFESVIPRNIRLAEAPSFGKPIYLYDPNSAGALAYRMLAHEVIAREFGVMVDSSAQPSQEIAAAKGESV